VKAIPAEGYRFVKWTKQIVNQDISLSKATSQAQTSEGVCESWVIMDADKILTAHFEIISSPTLLVTFNFNPSFVSTSLPDATTDVKFKFTLQVEDLNINDYHVFVLIESPEWLTIDTSTGELTGTPGNEDAGNDIPITVRVTDSGGLRSELSTTINVIRSDIGDLKGIVVEKDSNKPIGNSIETIVVSEALPVACKVEAPYPNPFNPATTIQYELQSDSHVRLIIYDSLGRAIKVLQDRQVSAGVHEIVWDATDQYGVTVGSGVYLYHFKADTYVTQGKLMLLR